MLPEVAQLTREQIEEATAPWTCPSCGNRNAFTENSCLSCGAVRRQGPPPLPGQPARAPADLITSPPALAGAGATGGKYGCGALILISAGIAVFLCFASFGFLLLWGRNHAKQHPETLAQRHGRGAFETASKTIANNDDGMAHGNTPEAQELAARLAEDLDEAHKNIPHIGDADSGDRTGGHFLVFCQLSGDSCVFLVHVPNLRHFPVDAQKGIAKICFMEASSVLKGSSAAGIHRLAVATRGALFFDTALLGDYPLENRAALEHLESLKVAAWDVPGLYPFFLEKSEVEVEKPEVSATPPNPAVPPTPASSTPSVNIPKAAPVPSRLPETPATPGASGKQSASATPVSPTSAAPPAVAIQERESKTPPSWVPIYPVTIRPAHGTRKTEDGIVKGRVAFETVDPLDKVKEFYESRFKTDGFEITADKSTARLFENAEIAGRREAGNSTLHVAIHQLKARTFVTVTYEGAEGSKPGQ